MRRADEFAGLGFTHLRSVGVFMFGLKVAIATIGAVLTVLAAPTGAYANVMYVLTLTATSDSQGLMGSALLPYDGTGTITLSSPPSATTLSVYSTAPVSFMVDGVSFSGTADNVEFLDGNFYSAQFSEQVGTNPNRFDLQTSGVYAFYYGNEQYEASGTITSSPATTPLPTALPLLAGGLGMVGFLSRRKKRKAASFAAT